MQNLIWICRCSIMLRSHGNSYVHLLHSFHQVQSSIIVPWPLAHLSASLLHDERHGGALIEQSQLAILAYGQWQSMIVTDSHWQVSGKFMHLMRLGHHLQKVTSMCPSEQLPMTCIRIPLAKCNEKHLHATFAVAPDSSCRRGMQKCHHTEEFGGCHPPQTLSSFHTELQINPIYASWVHIKTLHTPTCLHIYTHAVSASILKPFTSRRSIPKEITPKQSLIPYWMQSNQSVPPPRS